MQKPLIAISASIALSLSLGLNAEDEEIIEEKLNLPALKILPINSTLKDVSIPRFNKDLSPASLLIADSLTVLTKQKIAGLNVDLSLFQEDGSPRICSKMKEVTYDHSNGIIRSSNHITLSGEEFALSSQGAVLDWEKQQGFFLGKTQILFYINKAKQMTSPKTPEKPTSKEVQKKTPPSTLKKNVAATAVALSFFPPLLTANQVNELGSTLIKAHLNEIEAIDGLAKPMAHIANPIDKIAKNELASAQSASKQIDTEIETLKTTFGAESFIIQNKETPASPKLKQQVKKPKTKKTVQAPVKVTLTADGGSYFDAKKGVAVSSKNIVITHPEYKLTCSDELKIFLKKEAAQKAKNKAIVDPMQNLGDIDKAIATGNVIIKGKDANGLLVTAKANTATYNHKTETFILKGGNPTVQHDGSIGRIRDNTGYILIKLEKNNIIMRLEGKHEVTADANKLQNKKL